MNNNKKFNFSWRQITIGLIVVIVIPIIGYQFHCLVQADQKNETKIEEKCKVLHQKLEKKTDNETLKLYIQMIQKDNEANRQQIQMQLNNQKDLIQKLEK